MTLLALIVALLVEQIKPLPVDRFVIGPLRTISAAMVERFNDGHRRNGRIAWVLVIIALTLASGFSSNLIVFGSLATIIVVEAAKPVKLSKAGV